MSWRALIRTETRDSSVRAQLRLAAKAFADAKDGLRKETSKSSQSLRAIRDSAPYLEAVGDAP